MKRSVVEGVVESVIEKFFNKKDSRYCILSEGILNELEEIGMLPPPDDLSWSEVLVAKYHHSPVINYMCPDFSLLWEPEAGLEGENIKELKHRTSSIEIEMEGKNESES